MALEAVAFAAGFLQVAFRAIVHFMPPSMPGLPDPEHPVAPDIPAVSGNPVFLVLPQRRGLPDITMACPAFHVRALDMGGMGEEHAGRLLGICQPRYFLVLFDVFLDEFLLVRVVAHGIHVAAFAFIERGGAGEAAVIAEKVA